MSIATIAPAELQALITAGTTVDLIDVRNAGEFAAVHAAGAINRPLGDLDPARLLAERKAPAGDPLYLMCDSGARSATAAEAFLAAGFANAVIIAGGTAAWEAAGLTVVCAPASPPAPAAVSIRPRLPVLVDAPAPESVPLGRRPGVLPVVAIIAGIVLWIVVFMVPSRTSATTMSIPGNGLTHGPPIDFAQAVVAPSKVKPVVVYFYAIWCAPCKTIEPELDAVLAAHRTAVSVVRIDTDDNQTLAKAQGITGIPNVQLWKNGHEVAHFSGSMTRADITSWLEAALLHR